MELLGCGFGLGEVWCWFLERKRSDLLFGLENRREVGGFWFLLAKLNMSKSERHIDERKAGEAG